MAGRLKTRQNAPRQILGVISASRAEQMLMELVNTDLVNKPEERERLSRLFPEISPLFPPTPKYPRPPKKIMLATAVPPVARLRLRKQPLPPPLLAQYLRKAWDAADLRHFEWYTWQAQSQYQHDAAVVKHIKTPLDSAEDVAVQYGNALREAAEPPAIITPVEAAIFYLRHNRKRALHCPNSECPAPYFFATKKSQKYCSPECAKPSLRESKRKWWADNRAKEEDI